MNTDIEKISNDLAAQAQGLRVVDQSSANRATQLVLIGKEAIKKIKAFFTPLKQAQDEAKRKLLDSERQELGKVEPIVDALSRSIASWRMEEDRKLQAAEAERLRIEREKQRLEEEALRKVKEAEEAGERERLRLEQEAIELQKKEQEALAADDKAALVKIDEEREEIRQEAQAALDMIEKATDKAIDEAAKADAAIAPAPVIPDAPKTAGLSMRYNYSFEVTDKSALPEEYKIADQKALDAMARLKKDEFRIPGGGVVKTPSVAARPGRPMSGYSETH